jgi:hypothetical protein
LSYYGYGTKLLKLCINGVQKYQGTDPTYAPILQDDDNNYLGGPYTRAIYYTFELWLLYSNCPDFWYSYSTGAACDYVCYYGGAVPCAANTHTFDAECQDSGASCGDYGCVQDAPVSCMTSTCPPSTFSDATCESCYTDSRRYDASSCACDIGAATLTTIPLSCACKVHVVCTGLLSDVGLRLKCSSCFPHAYNYGYSCLCNANYYPFSTSGSTVQPQLVCSGKLHSACTGALVSDVYARNSCAQCYWPAIQGATSCDCPTYWYKTATSNSFACSCKLKTDCYYSQVTAVAAVNECSKCYANSAVSGGSCACASGYYTSYSSPWLLVCYSKL